MTDFVEQKHKILQIQKHGSIGNASDVIHAKSGPFLTGRKFSDRAMLVRIFLTSEGPGMHDVHDMYTYIQGLTDSFKAPAFQPDGWPDVHT